ncbi:RNA-directed DNA polymerase, eukaryota, Reverse transcriptase zinc-binding domain protein [Artemisia annua]|uniref:RNA-directed DNA polymerase, eukaryota, Reverse transcriptase zinc-binding domain protein n=1 Tax=Artemisia annua TaxID=35608 RepID=A0A2U1NBN5_ARTAN|nr:RNA-directed DNA polymerase, eukaryota, Reverse transcriptase zinc-binding domain protein [Artemisia annua]
MAIGNNDSTGGSNDLHGVNGGNPHHQLPEMNANDPFGEDEVLNNPVQHTMNEPEVGVIPNTPDIPPQDANVFEVPEEPQTEMPIPNQSHTVPTQTHSSESSIPTRKSTRSTTQPAWLKDFVTGKHRASMATKTKQPVYPLFHEKDFEAYPEEMIEVGGALGYDVKGCKRSLKRMINGIGSKKRKKRVWIKELCFKHNIHILGVQETKMTKLELFQLKSMWGNFKFDYACSMARGRSGGLVTMWDPSVFVKNRIWCSDNFIIVEGKWMNSVDDYYIINVYGPQHQPEKTNLWEFLRSFIQNHVGNTILFGDLNEVRYESERFGSYFSRSDAAVFNSFIHDVGLIDLPMGGRMYTWMNKAGSKLSKIDRFLISDGVLSSHSDMQVTVLDKVWSDHNPILLHCKKSDFGPIPFRIFHSWFDRNDFDDVVKEAWQNFSVANMSLHDKLRGLKDQLKLWYSRTKEIDYSRKKSILTSLKILEEKIDAGCANENDKTLRVNTLQELAVL